MKIPMRNAILFFFICIFFDFFVICRTKQHDALQSYDLLQLTECEKRPLSFSCANFAKRRLVGNKARGHVVEFLSVEMTRGWHLF